jgi:anti-anti-sigma factor
MVEHVENRVEMKLHNELVAGNCQPVKEELVKAHLHLPVSGAVILDLQGVPYVDSGAAAMLLDIHRRLKRNGKTLVLKNLNAHVARVIEMLNLTTVFTIQSKE